MTILLFDQDGREHDGILIAETHDNATPDRYWLARADQDAPFRRGFAPPLTPRATR